MYSYMLATTQRNIITLVSLVAEDWSETQKYSTSNLMLKKVQYLNRTEQTYIIYNKS